MAADTAFSAAPVPALRPGLVIPKRWAFADSRLVLVPPTKKSDCRETTMSFIEGLRHTTKSGAIFQLNVC